MPFKLLLFLKPTPINELEGLEELAQDNAIVSTVPISSDNSSSKTIFLKYKEQIFVT
jgi:hypothetical protein